MHGPVPPRVQRPDTSLESSRVTDGAGPAPDGVDALRVLWRRKATVFAVTGLVLLVTLLVVLNQPPAYTASAEIMLIPSADDTSEGDGATGDSIAAVASEVEVLRSRALLRRVVRQEQLLLDPEFNSAVRKPTGLFARVGMAPGPVPEDLRIQRQRARTVAALDRRLSVHALGRSRVIEVAVASENPAKAAQLVNVLARVYVRDRRDARSRSRARDARYLRTRAAEARKRLAKAERAYRRFRREAGLIAPSDVNADEIARLRSKLTQARAERAEKAARVSNFGRRLAKGGPMSIPAGLASPLLDMLQEQLAAAMGRKSALSTQYGPRHPKVLEAQSKVESLRRQAESAARNGLVGLRDELRIAKTHVRTLADELAGIRREAKRRAAAEVRMAGLRHEVETAREARDTILARLDKTSLENRARQPGARVISPAVVPAEPSAPRTDLIMALALLAGLPCGLVVAIVMERLDRGIAGLEQLGETTRLTPLAVVPRVSGSRARTLGPADEARSRPASAFAASIDRAYTSLLQARANRPPAAILITSALPREGKTTIALALARMLARRGRRVILVEADLRRPNVAWSLDFARQPGLAEHLAGRAPFDTTIRRDSQRGLHIMPAGRRVADPGRMLSSRRFAMMLRALTSGYDCVIVDAPPVLPVADARVLAPLVDASVLVTRWRKTPARTAALAAMELRAAGGVVPGAVLTRVDARRSRLEDTAEQPVHGRAIQAYYTS